MRKDLAKCVTETYRSSAGSVEQIYKIYEDEEYATMIANSLLVAMQ